MAKSTYLCAKCGAEVSAQIGNVGEVIFGGVLCSSCRKRGWQFDPDANVVQVDMGNATPTEPKPAVETTSTALAVVEEVAAEREPKMAVPEPVAPRDPELEYQQQLTRELQEWRKTHVYEVPPDLGRMAQIVTIQALNAIGTDDREQWRKAGRMLEQLGQTIHFIGNCGYLRIDDAYIPTIQLREALFGKPAKPKRQRKSA